MKNQLKWTTVMNSELLCCFYTFSLLCTYNHLQFYQFIKARFFCVSVCLHDDSYIVKLDTTIYFPFGRQHDKIHWQNSLYIMKCIHNNVIALWVLGGRGLIIGSFAITQYVPSKNTTVQFYSVLTCFII